MIDLIKKGTKLTIAMLMQSSKNSVEVFKHLYYCHRDDDYNIHHNVNIHSHGIIPIHRDGAEE